MNFFLLHTLTVGLDSFYTDLRLVGKEDEELVGRVVVVSDEDYEIAPRRPLLARLVAELFLELLQCLIELVLGHEVTSVVTQLHHRLPYPPQLVSLGLVIHHVGFQRTAVTSSLFYLLEFIFITTPLAIAVLGNVFSVHVAEINKHSSKRSANNVTRMFL